MTDMLGSAGSDHNLLLGILAYQNAFVTRDALFSAMQAWLYDKKKTLAEILQAQGALDGESRALLEALVNKHLKQHGDDPRQSLQAISSVGSVREALGALPDRELQASIGHLSQGHATADPFATRAPSAGESTSQGTRFRILRPHGEGGLGKVYVALDSELNREVALKEIKDKYADDVPSRSRFLLEAEITGGLEHPGIVPVYGLGTYADGRPFYAMRFIKGDSLMDAIEAFHARGHKLTQGERGLELQKLLRRLIDVCFALQYAHDRGVLHRDLKPGNIMLGKYGETLVVDWGLAKPRGQADGAPADGEMPLVPASGSDSVETVAGTALGTPAYMSPEQAEGRLDLLGPASDVYGLGATLYCLLTGKPPFEGPEVLDRVRRGKFPPPSQVQTHISAPLEAICLKAMALKIADRYAAPRQLAEEIEHWLADEPVRAWPEPWTVKARRWVAQHRTLVTASAATILVAACALTVITAVLAAANDEQRHLTKKAEDAQTEAEADRQLAQDQEKNAVREAGRANRIADMLTKMFETADPVGLNGIPFFKNRVGESLTVRDILARGSAKVSRELNDDPQTQAKLLDMIGNVFCTLGLTSDAGPLLEKALHQLRQSLPADHPDLAANLQNLAFVYHMTGDYVKAGNYYREALAIREKHAAQAPIPYSNCMFCLAWLLTDLNEFAPAEQLFQKTIDVRVAALGPGHRDVAVARGGMASLLITQQRFLPAFAQYQQAMSILRKVEGSQGMIESIDLFQTGILGRQVPLLRPVLGLKDDQAVVSCFARSFAIAKKALNDPPIHAYLGLILHEWAFTLAKQKKEDEAEKIFAQCLTMVRGYGLQHPKMSYLLANYTVVLTDRGKTKEANLLLDEALQSRRACYAANHYAIADVLFLKGAIAGGADVKRKLLRDALDIYCQSPHAPGGFDGNCLELLCDCAAAAELYQVGCQIARAALRPDNPAGKRERYQNMAMFALRRAHEKGFRDRQALETNPDLEALRQRSDFQSLRAALKQPGAG